MDAVSDFLGTFENFMKMFYTHINPIINYQTWNGHKLRENQIKIIMILNIEGEVTPTFLSNILNTPKGSLTTLIRSLVKMDLITKVFTEENERSYRIKLTKEGKKFVQHSKTEKLKSFSELFKNLSQKEISTIIDGFTVLNKCLENNQKMKS